MDHVLIELNTRFATHQVQNIQGICLVLDALVALTPDDAKQKLKSLTSLYRDDLPFPGSVESEFHCWQMKWRAQRDAAGPDSLPKTLSVALDHANKHIFPNMKTLLSIICVLPVTKCSSECSEACEAQTPLNYGE